MLKDDGRLTLEFRRMGTAIVRLDWYIAKKVIR
jgi:hypothetical protein